MKINVFKIENDSVSDLADELLENEYEIAAEKEDEHCHFVLYVKKKHFENEGWLNYYKNIVSDEDFSDLTADLGSDALSGVFLIETDKYNFAIAHGQAHFIVRKFCDKDFGLDLAERIVDPKGLKMKHSQTFTSASKKDITSYTSRRDMNDSQEYGEAFSYVKCKTIRKEEWGESADFGESARFSFGKGFSYSPENLYMFTDRIHQRLSTESLVKLPRYRKVTDKTILDHLRDELKRHFQEFLECVDVDDYWLTGVSFNFANDYRYQLRFKHTNLTEIIDTIDTSLIKQTIAEKTEIVGTDFDKIRVVFFDDDDNPSFARWLFELIQVTIEHNGKYYVLFKNDWVEFSESYIAYIKEQADTIPFEIKDCGNKTEDELIDSLVSTGEYTQLHKQNVYIRGYCIEEADLMDDDNVIMIKDQNQISDLVYLVKQATTSLRLSASGELPENRFIGHNVCLWMLINRKKLNKLSDFKSFHLLDALNDFKREVNNMNLSPLIWISLKN